MARSIETTIDINAPIEEVWRILTDLPHYGEWNPLVVRAAGPLTVGKRLAVAVQLPGRGPMSFTPILVALVPQQEFRWLGTFVVPGLFTGEHSFRLISQSHGTTLFIHSERFTGILPPLMGGQWYERVRQGFESMNQAMKERAERQATE
jgi:hypothetical protein